jgi:MoaA/NifB/PqqE/SkfB family radical SAM enzyme
MKETISSRIDAVTAIPEGYRAEKIPAPKSVKIEITSRCNFKCSFCAHQQGSKQQGDMDFDLFMRLADEMRAAGVEELGMFYIGESMMCKWLPDAIEYAKKIGFPYVFLTTNGSLATPDRVEAIMKAGLDSLKFSFNNANASQFEEMAGLPPKMFEKIIENMKQAWAIREDGGYATKLYASSIKYDGDQAGRMQKAVDRIAPFVDEHYWLPLLSFGDQATEQEEEMGLKPVVGNPGRLATMRAPLPCWAVFREGHITSEGRLSACCFDSSDSWKMADLKEVSFMEGWNSLAFQMLRKAHLDGDVHGTACESCIHGKKS